MKCPFSLSNCSLVYVRLGNGAINNGKKWKVKQIIVGFPVSKIFHQAKNILFLKSDVRDKI